MVFIQFVNSLIKQLIVLQLIKNMVLVDDLLIKECDILFPFFLVQLIKNLVLVNDLLIEECDILFLVFFATIDLFDYLKLVFIESTITQSLPQQLKNIFLFLVIYEWPNPRFCSFVY